MPIAVGLFCCQTPLTWIFGPLDAGLFVEGVFVYFLPKFNGGNSKIGWKGCIYLDLLVCLFQVFVYGFDPMGVKSPFFTTIWENMCGTFPTTKQAKLRMYNFGLAKNPRNLHNTIHRLIPMKETQCEQQDNPKKGGVTSRRHSLKKHLLPLEPLFGS